MFIENNKQDRETNNQTQLYLKKANHITTTTNFFPKLLQCRINHWIKYQIVDYNRNGGFFDLNARRARNECY